MSEKGWRAIRRITRAHRRAMQLRHEVHALIVEYPEAHASWIELACAVDDAERQLAAVVEAMEAVVLGHDLARLAPAAQNGHVPAVPTARSPQWC